MEGARRSLPPAPVVLIDDGRCCKNRDESEGARGLQAGRRRQRRRSGTQARPFLSAARHDGRSESHKPQLHTLVSIATSTHASRATVQSPYACASLSERARERQRTPAFKLGPDKAASRAHPRADVTVALGARRGASPPPIRSLSCNSARARKRKREATAPHQARRALPPPSARTQTNKPKRST